MHLSVGAIVQAVHGVARQAETAVREVLEQVRASVVQGEKPAGARTGATAMFGPSALPANDTSCVGVGIRGWSGCWIPPSAEWVSDFYAAYTHYPGLKQRCWAHLLRDIHDLKGLYPEDAGLAQWAEAVHQVYTEARSFPEPSQAIAPS